MNAAEALGELHALPWALSASGPPLDDEPEVGLARERQMESLHPRSADWLLGLPVDVRPSCTAAWYPHVVNRLCDIWHEASTREAYFTELLFSQREGRRGFEALVMEELIELQQFVASGASATP